MSEVNANYDSTWKEALSQNFEDFLIFFFPSVHELIDWSQPPQPLDKELEQIVHLSNKSLAITENLIQVPKTGAREVDKLFLVKQKDGTESYVLIHVEIQSQEDSKFPKRMYQYNYRCFDLYEKPVISLAILGDENASWRPNSYSYSAGGTEVYFKFSTSKLLDFQADWQALEQSNNPFAILVMAHLKTKATNNAYEERAEWKWRLVRGLYERGYDREYIERLFRLIDWMMALPEQIQQSFETRLQVYLEEKKMPILSHIEIRASRQTAREYVLEFLSARFGEIPSDVGEQLNQIEDLSIIRALVRRAATVNNIAEFQQAIREISSP